MLGANSSGVPGPGNGPMPEGFEHGVGGRLEVGQQRQLVGTDRADRSGDGLPPNQGRSTSSDGRRLAPASVYGQAPKGSMLA